MEKTRNVKVNTPEMADYLVEKGFELIGNQPNFNDRSKYVYWFKYKNGIYAYIKMYWELKKDELD